MDHGNIILIFVCFWPQDSSQIGLLKELLDLQKDMVVMLLSLLEGKYIFIVDKFIIFFI